MKNVIWVASWGVSALLFIPCLFLTTINGIDYHYRFREWWWKNVLSKFVV
jgi:hypothetical protein